MKREVKLVPYDCTWKQRFETIKENLMIIFSGIDIDIHHIGSTAIPGMPAKPIIDVMITVFDLNAVDGLNDKMKETGYLAKGENGISGRRYFQKPSGDGVNHLVHIHCYQVDDPLVRDHLWFRDYLKVDCEAFAEYRSVKEEAARLYQLEPLKYTEFKADCIKRIMDKARIYFQDSRI